MNWDIVEGKWSQLKGSVRQKWGNLTDSDLETVRGEKDKFLGLLQERYGKRRDEVEKELDEWLRAQRVQ